VLPPQDYCYTQSMNQGTPKSLENRNILLGVSGGISCYKSADLVRKLIEAGAHVQVVMTAGALEFISELTFQALSGNPVHTDLLDPQAEAAMGHIELARWADVVVIAPATANTLARITHGLADDLLTTICLATDAPLAVVPAMNRLMWSNQATQDNVAVLERRGVAILGPGSGSQACGETGAGRMLEPLEIRDALPAVGKMGFSIAEQAMRMGANVTLVAGPVAQTTPAGANRIDVKSAEEMHKAVMQHTGKSDVFIAVAAVADYRVADVADHKIKKSEDNLTLNLARTKDILADVAALPNGPFCVGFAAETQDMEKYARGKLVNKNLDMIAANPVMQAGKVVFGSDTNSLEVFWHDNGRATIPAAPKVQVAQQLLELIAVQYRDGNKDSH